MITREDLIQNKNLALDKAIGSLSGLAIGDSFGDAARGADNQRDYGITTDFNKGASWSTDDTEFALMTAKLLIEHEGNFTSDDVVNMWFKYVATEDELKRGGVSEVEACNNLRRGLRPPQSGMYNAYYMSDGAAMRSGPIGIVCAGDPERAADLAYRDACVSHYREGIWGAQAVAVAVSLAMVDADMEDIMEAIFKIAPPDSWFYETLNRAMNIVKEADGDIANAWMPLHNHASLYCCRGITGSFWMFDAGKQILQVRINISRKLWKRCRHHRCYCRSCIRGKIWC